MQNLPDYHLDALFRAALEEEAEALASTASSESQMLERVGRALARRRTRRQLATLLLAAAVTTLTAAAIALGGSRPTPPINPERSPEASSTPEPSVAEPAPSLGTELDEGPVVLWNPRVGGPPITVTIPAPGWSMDPGNRVLLKNGNQSQPDGAYLHGMWTTGELYIPADPCQWLSTMPDTPATTVDEIVAALASQASRDASEPVDITVDGHHGKSITLHVPDDLGYTGLGDFPDCDVAAFCSLSSDPAAGCLHTLYRPGQVDEMWIVDVDGQVLIMEGAYYADSPPEHVDELRAILASMTFGDSDGEVVHGWPDTTENQAGVYSWNGSPCGGSCNQGFMHNGYGSGNVRISIELLPEGPIPDDGANAVTVAGRDAVHRGTDARNEAWYVDIEGTTIAIRLTAQPDTSEADLAEAHAIIDSMRTEAVDNDLGFRLVFTLTTNGWDSG